jgi:hypothetical protein
VHGVASKAFIVHISQMIVKKNFLEEEGIAVFTVEFGVFFIFDVFMPAIFLSGVRSLKATGVAFRLADKVGNERVEAFGKNIAS